jgi:hypothetical protein
VIAASALGAAGISAAVAAAIGLLTLWVAGLRAERARRRDLYAEALAATMAYREFPYAIRRRRGEAEHRSAERVRISEALREVQRDLSQHQALMRIERATKVATAYQELVGKTREIAGGYMKDAWQDDPVETDPDMNMRVPLDYSVLDKHVQAYLDAVKRICLGGRSGGDALKGPVLSRERAGPRAAATAEQS